jgi:hypothetical protein
MMIPASNFCSTLNANVNNEKLTDAEFREFVRNSLPIVDFPRPKVVLPTDHSACKFVAKGR